MNKTKHFISFGGGVQTVALTAMNVLKDKRLLDAMGGFAECGIFADTKWETAETYEYLSFFRAWCNARDFKIHVVSKGNLRYDALNNPKRFIPMPLFTLRHVEEDVNQLSFFQKTKKRKIGKLRRQCTREYKAAPVDKKIKKLLGVKKYGRVKETVDLWIGISRDEAMRMKDSREKWKRHRWPLIDINFTRDDCKKYLRSINLPVPPKSACIGCPFHDDKYWMDMKTNHPKRWKNDAVDFDHRSRNITKLGNQAPVFLHDSCVPLDEVIFEESGNNKNRFLGECEGMCGV